MVPVRLSDSLSIRATTSQSSVEPDPIALQVVSCVGRIADGVAQADLPTDSSNLVVRALELLRLRAGCLFGAQVQLIKRIPAAAGLGGGSSDAAAALQLGNHAWSLGLTQWQLAGIAAELGSDVPFFLSRGAAICRGRGERVEQIDGAVPLNVVIVKPPEGLATAEVYRTWDSLTRASNARSSDQDPHRLLKLAAALRRGDLAALARYVGNQLQAAAASLSPWIARIETACAGLDFIAHQLTGSGTAYFGVCRHAQHARRLATILRTRRLGLVCATRTCR
jgi:4-diphosphocytidyl-2-C-methyl-D-erythritol kinase